MYYFQRFPPPPLLCSTYHEILKKKIISSTVYSQNGSNSNFKSVIEEECPGEKKQFTFAITIFTY